MEQILQVNTHAMPGDSFIFRIWQEKGRVGWKGWVQHARSGESDLFQSLDELLSFIEQQAGKLTGPTPKGLK